MSDKFGDERDPYLYPALNVLRNRLGIRQAKNLQQAAFEMTALRAEDARTVRAALGDCLVGIPRQPCGSDTRLRPLLTREGRVHSSRRTLLI